MTAATDALAADPEGRRLVQDILDRKVMTADPRIEAAAEAYIAQRKRRIVVRDMIIAILAAADAVDPLRQPGHVIDLRETGYGLQHPPECRPNLLDCELDVFLSKLDEAPAAPGQYRVELSDGELIMEPAE
ncbi:DUF6085 family protein [Arthrobacter silvisoli]|uniref:DUF6085 family protein n=1 Tax=Arthrobacter silvisoli TaxID=2291022 RepID=UPI000E213818|nr:DUF6085 family protein [Arthrobacter silvisoli]